MIELLAVLIGMVFLVDMMLILFSWGEMGLLLYLIKKGIVRLIEIHKGSGYLHIPFKTFEHLYYISPDKWDIDVKDYVRYRKYFYNYERFEFNLWDYFKYQNFRKQINKKGEKKLRLAQKEAQHKRLEECTKLWTKDIEAFAAENEKRMKAAKIENEEIIKRILGERA